MRKLFFIAALLIGLSAQAQTVVAQDSKTGNYYEISKPKEADKLTGKNFIDSKGEAYPVYETPKGKLYYKRISQKTQKEYRVYITTEAKKAE